MGETRCLYPGSFDPVTNGHLDVIKRAASLFDEVIVAVMINAGKHGCFPEAQRVELLKKVCAQFPNVRVLSFRGLTVELAQKLGARVLIRGVRGASDVENEMMMARANRMLSPNIETLFLPASPGQETISSSFVREIAGFGGDISAFVPAEVLGDIKRHFDSARATT